MKTIKFLYDMVEGDFHSFRTYGRDTRAEDVAAQIEEAMGRQEIYIRAFAELVVYTQDMRFAWRKDTPDELRALETFWNMRKGGANDVDSFRYYAEHVSNAVMLGAADDDDDRVLRRLARMETMRADGGDWQQYYVNRVVPLLERGRAPQMVTWIDAKNQALRRWIPLEWRLEDELTDEERADPNSDSGK